MYQLDKSIEKGMIVMLAYKNSGDQFIQLPHAKGLGGI